MKTKFALAFYYLAIGFLTVCAVVIVIKLILWPPCTQIGNTCVVEPWSVAGLAGTVLAVSATVLAVLGAVAVAAWWTSLNDRVVEQVKGLYEAQKKEVNTQVDLLLKNQKAATDTGMKALLKDQQQKMDLEFRAFEGIMLSLREEITRVHAFAELTNDLVKQSFERAEKRVEQLLQKDSQATGMLVRMQEQLDAAQERAAILGQVFDDYKEAIATWQKLKDAEKKMQESDAKSAGSPPSNGASN